MSAFIVSHAHIDALLDFACRAGVMRGAISSDLNEVGTKLMAANIASVCRRYSEPAEVYCLEALYVHGTPRRQITPVEAIKAAACFDYQACEVNGYDDTFAAKFMASIRDAAITKLPGYASAAWEITSETLAA